MDRTFVFGAVAPDVSPPIESVLTTGGPDDSAGFGAGFGGGPDDSAEEAESVADGLFAIMGVRCGCGWL